MARIPKLDSAGRFLAADVNAQIDARTKATMRADLPALAKELKIGGGSGIEQVSGTVTLDASGDPIREFFTTGATTFNANGATTPLGASTAVVWRRTSQGSWGYQVVQDGWTTPTPTPDTTAPVAGTLTVTVTDVKADMSASGASDDRGSVQYSFSKDNGATWTAYQDAATYTFTGLTASTAYQFRHRVRDAAGNVTTGTAVSKTTAATPPEVVPSGAYDDAALALAPTFYLPLDDPAGTDSPRTLGAATAKTYTINGSVTFGAPGIGDGATATQFGGSGYMSSTGGYTGATAPVSVACLAKLTTADSGILSDGSVIVGVLGGKLALRTGSTTYTSTGKTLTPGTRYHLGWVATGSEVRFYVNGALDSTVPATFSGGGGATSPGLGLGKFALATLAGMVGKGGAAWTATEMGQLAQAAGLKS